MIKNATTSPKVYYGLHMVEGVAEYREPGEDPYRILIAEQAIKNMDPSFSGKPVYVKHVDQVDLANLQAEADGYVSESFFNEKDGKHWVKFIVVSDRGHEAIRSGWRLSNAYVPKELSSGGLWHGVEYSKEVKRGEYEHLAIVPNPRYDESVIYTPEEFKAYNERKEQELQMLTNEIEGESSMLNFFKRSKVENSSDLENTVVVLPKSKKELTISELVKNADMMEEEKKEPKMANGEDMVQVGDESMTVNALIAKHLDMIKPKNDDENLKEEAEKQKKNEEEKKAAADKMAADEKKKNEDKVSADAEKAKKNENFQALKNAHLLAAQEQKTVEISMDKMERGKQRYGSK